MSGGADDRVARPQDLPTPIEALLEARVDSAAEMPGIESIFHAWLLTLENVRFVGQCHPVAVNQILASPRARDFAEHRMFPDEILFCGAMSVYVPYADPGLPLAWQIRERTRDFIREHGMAPQLKSCSRTTGSLPWGSAPANCGHRVDGQQGGIDFQRRRRDGRTDISCCPNMSTGSWRGPRRGIVAARGSLRKRA